MSRIVDNCPNPDLPVSELSKKDQLYELIRANPFISQQDLAVELRLSRSAVAGYIAGLIRERRLLGRAYVLPDSRPIVCIGAANLDRKLRSIAPLKQGTSNPARQDESYGGVARNIAENLARLGAPAALLTAVGDDSSGAAMLAQAQQLGIDTRGTLKLSGACTGTYTAILDEQGEMLLAMADMSLYDKLTPKVVSARQPQRMAAALTVADMNLPADTLALLLQEAQRDAVPLIVVAVSQPKMARLPAKLQGARLLILNQGELEVRVGHSIHSDEELRAACMQVRAEGVRDLIVTRGSTGVVYTTRDDNIAFLAAREAQVVDVTGAGDAFAAAVAWSLYQGSEDLALACRRGLQLSAMTLECEETVCPWLHAGVLDEIHNFNTPFNLLYQD